jgi:hypothetical protein
LEGERRLPRSVLLQNSHDKPPAECESVDLCALIWIPFTMLQINWTLPKYRSCLISRTQRWTRLESNNAGANDFGLTSFDVK